MVMTIMIKMAMKIATKPDYSVPRISSTPRSTKSAMSRTRKSAPIGIGKRKVINHIPMTGLITTQMIPTLDQRNGRTCLQRAIITFIFNA